MLAAPPAKENAAVRLRAGLPRSAAKNPAGGQAGLFAGVRLAQDYDDRLSQFGSASTGCLIASLLRAKRLDCNRHAKQGH